MGTSQESQPDPTDAHVTDIPLGSNERDLTGAWYAVVWLVGVAFTSFHLYTLNVSPMETWSFRIVHVAGGLVLGFCLLAAGHIQRDGSRTPLPAWQWALLLPSVAATAYAGLMVCYLWFLREIGGMGTPPEWILQHVKWSLPAGAGLALVGGWLTPGSNRHVHWTDLVLAACAVIVAAALIFMLQRWRLAAGTSFIGAAEALLAIVGVGLIMELTRRVAGLALLAITAIFLGYAFAGPWLPGILEHGGYTTVRFFTYVYTDNGILGPTTAVSSTYIILFITFAAFLQASRVGDYFVNFAFAAAGRTRGGPAKVAVFASGLMGMINGTSAGNVVATGSLTIPLMKKVGYHPRSAGAIEAAASTGGQIVPPIMGAGAFIMAEITGVPYVDIATAAVIPAALYFLSTYLMVDFEARRDGMSGLPASELPRFATMARQIYLFIPIVVLIGALFLGYSVIRAGTLAMLSAAVVSWLTPHWMGPKALLEALALGARMSVPLIAVCACAGIIVGVIALTGVGSRFASLLLNIADTSQLLAMFFAMCISILLGMGMPTTAAYAVAASVVAPGLQQMGIPPLVAHFFVFYYAVLSAITPPVALAAYAAAAVASTDPLRTSVTAFKFGLAAFIVPFMFFYSPALLGEGTALRVLQVTATASLGIYMLAAALQGWFAGAASLPFRAALLVGAICMIYGGMITDIAGMGIGAAVLALQRYRGTAGVRGD